MNSGNHTDNKRRYFVSETSEGYGRTAILEAQAIVSELQDKINDSLKIYFQFNDDAFWRIREAKDALVSLRQQFLGLPSLKNDERTSRIAHIKSLVESLQSFPGLLEKGRAYEIDRLTHQISPKWTRERAEFRVNTLLDHAKPIFASLPGLIERLLWIVEQL